MSEHEGSTEPKTHPQVLAIFGYTNPRAPRVPETEYARLLSFFKDVPAPNIATFIEAVQFDEKERGVTMSYNLVLCPRTVDPSKEPTFEEAMQMFRQRDLLVGTRRGVEGAMMWFSNLVEALKDDTSSIVTFDKIFGEAIPYLSVPMQPTSIGEMVAVAFGDKVPERRPEDGTKH